MLLRLILVLLVAAGTFVISIEVQDLLQGDVRSPKQCLNSHGQPIGCPETQPNVWLAGSASVVVALATFWLSASLLRGRTSARALKSRTS